ncbi:MAG: ABC transporter ATP-binding protein [Planctomycetes bacterium]|nr:ABC transporter ATP-binding protein [Planctomycetota bacterium]
MPPKGARVSGMGQEAPPPRPGQPAEGVPYLRLYRWAWLVVSGVLGFYALNVAVAVASRLVVQYNVQVLAIAISGLGSGGADASSGSKAGGEGETGAPAGGGFLSRLVPSNVSTAAVVFATLAIAGIGLVFLERMLTSWTDNRMVGRLQERLHDRLLILGPAFHSQHDLGQTTVVVTRYAGGSQVLLRELISTPIVQGVSLVTALVFLAGNLSAVAETPLWMRGLLLAMLVLLPVAGWWISTHVRAAFSLVRDSDLALASEFTNSASLPLEVQLMGAEKQRRDAFAVRVRDLVRKRVAAVIRSELATQFQGSVPTILQAVFLIYGVFFALKSGNPAAAGAILAIFYFVPAAISPIQQILQFFVGLSASWPQVQSVLEILEAKPEVAEKEGATDLALESAPDVRFEGVSFRFSPDSPFILDSLTHAFPAGRVTGIVARAGQGKSTLLNLLARLRDPESGAIRIGGRDVRDVTLSSLRRTVAKVSQFPLFLADSIRENLRLARAEATDEEFENALRRTGLWDVLVRVTPPGKGPLDYPLPRAIGEGLSGGQRRILGVTRALLWKPRILLLDDPTTGIDAIGKRELEAVLREIAREVTVLLVDHDIEFVCRMADEICCLEAGGFVEVGPPAELAGRQGYLARLLAAARAADTETEEGVSP